MGFRRELLLDLLRDFLMFDLLLSRSRKARIGTNDFPAVLLLQPAVHVEQRFEARKRAN